MTLALLTKSEQFSACFWPLGLSSQCPGSWSTPLLQDPLYPQGIGSKTPWIPISKRLSPLWKMVRHYKAYAHPPLYFKTSLGHL